MPSTRALSLTASAQAARSDLSIGGKPWSSGGRPSYLRRKCGSRRARSTALRTRTSESGTVPLLVREQLPSRRARQLVDEPDGSRRRVLGEDRSGLEPHARRVERAIRRDDEQVVCLAAHRVAPGQAGEVGAAKRVPERPLDRVEVEALPVHLDEARGPADEAKAAAVEVLDLVAEGERLRRPLPRPAGGPRGREGGGG